MSAHNDPQEIKKEVKKYLVVFISLAVLTVVTVAVSYLHLPVHQAVILALFIATIKGGLVACYFMHLISEKTLIYVVLAFTFINVIGVMLIPIFEADKIVGTVHHVS